jgi:3-hydroxyethyl bacteriochlorophyllide a dehydrogenase
MSFRFTPAFMREAKFRIAAEFRPADVHAVLALLASGRLSLDGLITHRQARRCRGCVPDRLWRSGLFENDT